MFVCLFFTNGKKVTSPAQHILDACLLKYIDWYLEIKDNIKLIEQDAQFL